MKPLYDPKTHVMGWEFHKQDIKRLDEVVAQIGTVAKTHLCWGALADWLHRFRGCVADDGVLHDPPSKEAEPEPPF